HPAPGSYPPAGIRPRRRLALCVTARKLALLAPLLRRTLHDLVPDGVQHTEGERESEAQDPAEVPHRRCSRSVDTRVPPDLLERDPSLQYPEHPRRVGK